MNSASESVAPAPWKTARRLRDEEELRGLLGFPSSTVLSKIAPRLNALTRQWVERSPFLCLATSAVGGDVSPRGDAPGFVRVLDEGTLLIPERPGNKLADSLRNILANPSVGLLFLIPGVDDTLRVNGRAWLSDDAELLEPSSAEGKAPRLGIVVEIDEVFTHCGKAFLRSKLWDPSLFHSRSSFPTVGEILRRLKGKEFDADLYDKERSERYARREGFY